jgi:hypothetical protein
MKSNGFELCVLVGGKPIREYEWRRHGSPSIFVEGRRGSDFEIAFKSYRGLTTEVVFSVDGLDVLTGKPATAESRGYVIRPHGELRIPGWKLDNDSVARFLFEEKKASYAEQSGSGSASAGVIGCMVWDEMPAIVVSTNYSYPYPWGYPRGLVGGSGGGWSSPTLGTASPLEGSGVTYSCNTISASCSSAPDAEVKTSGRILRSAKSGSFGARAEPEAMMGFSEPAAEAEAFNLGTGFGKKEEFRTSETEFKRRSVIAQLALYYDSKHNLGRRGIIVDKPSRRRLNDLPKPFAGTGCTPPPGWRG